MRPVFANSAFVTAPERLILRGGAWRRVRLKVRYGLFLHPQAGLVLIDTGYGPRVTEGPRSLPLRLYDAILGPQLVAAGQPDAVLQRLGFTTDDVSAVILEHESKGSSSGGFDDTLATLATKYGVSHQALALRLSTLGVL